MLQKLLWQEIRSQTRLFAGLFAVSILACFAIIGQAYAVAAIVHGAFLAERSVVDMGLYFVILIATAAGKSVASWAGEDLGGRLAAAVKTSLRQQILTHLLAAGPIAVPHQRTGNLLHLLSEGMEGIDAYCSKYLPQFVFLLIIPPVILAVVFNLDLTTTAILLFTAPLIPLFMILIGRWAEQLQQRQWQLLQFLSGHFLDVLIGLATLKAWGRSEEQTAVIARLSDKLRISSLGVLRVAFLSALTLELLTTLGTAVIAVTVGLKLLFGQLAFQQAFFILLLAPDFYLPFRQLGTHYHAGLAGINAAEQIQDLLNPKTALSEAASTGAPIASPPMIVFENVGFSYSSGHRPALHAVSFSVASGEHVALVGPSGAGKSTLFDLLLKFSQPQTGEIWIDGQRLSDLPTDQWRSSIAYVPQFPHLFQGTLRDNISFGALAKPGQVEQAAARAGLESWIEQLPAGYDTLIGEGGIGLSGGEAKRVAIARAFFRDAPLLLLDEAMTSLDPRNETLILDSIRQLRQNRTVLVIAHRISTAQYADRILVLQAGELIEAGPHRSLAAASGFYARLIAATGGLAR
jgi:ATP-binding cassette subfamily C protein CydD